MRCAGNGCSYAVAAVPASSNSASAVADQLASFSLLSTLSFLFNLRGNPSGIDIVGPRDSSRSMVDHVRVAVRFRPLLPR